MNQARALAVLAITLSADLRYLAQRTVNHNVIHSGEEDGERGYYCVACDRYWVRVPTPRKR